MNTRIHALVGALAIGSFVLPRFGWAKLSQAANGRQRVAQDHL